jgi:phosphoribosylformimino-5-aminoimidazole carboxamide ribotide isomerase
MNASTIFSEDPVSVAKHWIEEGGRRLHVVDLDGAFAGRPKNERLISEIVEAAGEVPVQVGGGIRTRAIAEAYFAAGVSSLIIGTKAIADMHFFEALVKDYPGRIILGLDARGEQIATEGWVTDVGISVAQYLSEVRDWPIQAIVYTDITRDGMMKGINFDVTKRVVALSGIPVIASGGVKSIDDLQALKESFQDETENLFGVISGRALYERELSVSEGQALLDSSKKA